jgi:hypothetical protein
MGVRLLTAFALLAVAGCGASGGEDRQEPLTADSWYAPPPDREFDPLGENRFAPVLAEHQLEAQAALAETAAKRLSAEEAARLTGKRLPADGEYVLLRGILLNEANGRFDVGVKGRAVYVYHGSLGRPPVPIRRKALVAVLPAVPETVYVSCGMAE